MKFRSISVVIGVGMALSTPAHAFSFESLLFDAGRYAMQIVTVLFMLIATVVYVGSFIYTQILIKLAFFIAPVMVPWIMLEKTRFIFEGWFKFLITAGLAKVVGSFFFGVLNSNIQNAQNISAMVAGQNLHQTLFVLYATLMLLMGISAFLMTKIHEVASGLVMGSIGGGFSMRVMQTANSAGSAAGSAAKAGGKAVNSAGGAVLGAMSGAKSAGAGNRLSGLGKGAVAGGMAGVTGMAKQQLKKFSGGGATPSPAGTTASAPKKSSQPSIRDKLRSVGQQAGRRP